MNAFVQFVLEEQRRARRSRHRRGRCVCGALVSAHFDKRNRKLPCDSPIVATLGKNYKPVSLKSILTHSKGHR